MDSWAMIVLRVVLGIVVFPHGAQKLMGWFGGYGFAGSMNYFTDTVGLPWLVGFVVIMLEFFGAIVLIIGFATPVNNKCKRHTDPQEEVFITFSSLVTKPIHKKPMLNA